MKGQLRLLTGQKIESPHGLRTRPTTARVREAVMNILKERLEKSSWLDLFSGSGVMSCEALNKGAKRILAIELNRKIARICRSNLSVISSGINHSTLKVEVISQDVIKYLKEGCISKSLNQTGTSIDPRFDIVYIDPPYESNLYIPTLNHLLSGAWVKKDSLVICEHSHRYKLIAPEPWIVKDRRQYGKTGLLLISPSKRYSSCTGSRHPQTGLGGLQG